METLAFKCPRTGRVIETGIVVDEATRLKIKALKLSLKCPHCGAAHQFPIESGFLAEAA